MRLIKDPDPSAGTRFRILETAMRLFAEFGLDAVPLRDIAREAVVNGAAINYHFGSKEQLIREVFRRCFDRVNALRVKALDDYEVAAKGRPLKPEQIIRALVEPMVRFSFSKEGGGIYFIPLLFHAYGVRRSFIDQSIYERVDYIVIRFVDALQSAMPHCGREELFWRFDFALGSCHHVLVDRQRSHRLKRLSNGLCDTDDQDQIIEQLVAALTGSFGAKAPAKSSKTPQYGHSKKKPPNTKSAKS